MKKLKTILFVDDNKSMLKSLYRAFLDEPYEVYVATSGAEALELMQRQTIDIVISDMRMPELGGRELLNMVRERYPKIVRILFSGQSMLEQEEISALVRTINQDNIFKFIGKTLMAT